MRKLEKLFWVLVGVILCEVIVVLWLLNLVMRRIGGG